MRKERSMKKNRILSLLITALLLVVSAMLLASCGQETIIAPESLILDSDTQTLNWRRVPKAASYEIVIGDAPALITQANYVSLEYLDAGEYEVKVRAISYNEKIEPSEWSVYTFIKEPESGLKYKLINNRTEYQLIGAGTASGDVVMESEFRGKPVTSIADKALNNVQKITSLVISKNVKDIGKSAFAKCNGLLSVSFEEGSKLESLGEYAFQSCKALDEITFPDSLTTVPGYAFSWCSGLKKVNLGANTTVIDPYAFSNCDSLGEIVFPETLVSIGQYAFSDCVSLPAVTLGDAVEVVSEFAFFNCQGIESLELGNGLQAIGPGAFGECVRITEVVIPDSVMIIGMQAFYGCTSLAEVELGSGLVSLGGEAFYNTMIFSESFDSDVIYIDDWVVGVKNLAHTAATLREGTVGIADYAFLANVNLQLMNLSGVKHIGHYAFYGCTSLMGVLCDDSLLSIGDYAFGKCDLLGTNEVKLGGGLVSIGSYAFEGCSRIASNTIDLPDTLQVIGTYAFNNTKAYRDAKDVVYIDDWAVGLQAQMYTDVIIKDGTRGIANYAFYRSLVFYSIELPDTVEYIGRGAFAECPYVSRFNLPANLKQIGDYAFYSCNMAQFAEDGITVIPEGTEYVGKSSFNQCASMVGVVVPGTVKAIGDFAFYKCEALGYVSPEGSDDTVMYDGKVVLEEGIETIGLRVFHGCNLLREIVIPDSVTWMDSRVFYQCESLKSVTLGDGLEFVPDYTFYGCAALTDVKFSSSVKTIGKYAFRGCIGISELLIGEGVEKIGDYAFYGCAAVRDIVIPESVKEIGRFAFRGCVGVSSVIIPDTVEVIGIHAFYGLNRASVFCEYDEIPAYWNERWNTSYRPVFWGCEFSEDGKRIESFTKNPEKLENMDSINGIADPYYNGYYFKGWATAPDGEVAYVADTLKDVPDGTVLYPVFVESDYFLVYDSNKPGLATFSPAGIMLKDEHLFGDKFALAPSAYTLIGWSFKGWSTTADGEVVYADEAEITEDITSEKGTTVTLYAVWEPKPYTIKFDGNKPAGASSDVIGVMPDIVSGFDQLVDLTANQFSLQGWKFVGWSNLPNGYPMIEDGQGVKLSPTEDETDNITLYAVWLPIQYFIQYNVNLPTGVSPDALSGTMRDDACSYDTVAVISNEYTLEGYTLLGWATSPNGNVVYHVGDEVRNLTINDGETIVLYAVWQKD